MEQSFKAVKELVEDFRAHERDYLAPRNTRLERECEALDRQIDQALYELYGLTEEEIKVVEGK